MRDGPSITAGWVAGCRTLGRWLPAAARLADDPWGVRFVGAPARFAARLGPGAALALWPMVVYMQVRTRAIDDVLRRFVADGGRQVVLLGAGYDCRAVRFADERDGARVFEVDHPRTQGRKREVLASAGAPSAPVTYVAWDFEERPPSELPGALRAEGHDPDAPTLTIWEGVTMYLTESVIDASVRAVRAWSSPGSELAVTYFDRRRVDRPSLARRVVAVVAAGGGEPFRFGWMPADVPAWFESRGFFVQWDREMGEIGRELLTGLTARTMRDNQSRLALLRTPDAAA